MTTDQQLDGYVRRMAWVTDQQVAERLDVDVQEDLLQRILEVTVPETGSRRHRTSTRRTAGRRRLLSWIGAIVGSVVLAGGGAIAWAVTTSHPSVRDTLSVQCLNGAGDGIIPATSGSPVADCTAAYRRSTGQAPPSMTAYSNGSGGITVLPAGWRPPPQFRPLPAGETQNRSLIELQESLGDYIFGLNAGCYGRVTATRLTTAKLANLGFSRWSVTVRTATANAGAACLNQALIEPRHRMVVLWRGGSLTSSQPTPWRWLAKALRPISERCQTLPSTAHQVEGIAARLGFSQGVLGRHGYTLIEVEQASRCTALYENVGGTTVVTLRGPAG